MGFMAYLIKPKFGSEVNSERTECHVIGHLGRLMSAVLLLGQFDRSFLNGSVRERLWLEFLSGRNRQWIDGAAVAALGVVADGNLHAAKLTHQIEGTCEHSCIGIVASFVGNDVRAKHLGVFS